MLSFLKDSKLALFIFLIAIVSCSEVKPEATSEPDASKKSENVTHNISVVSQKERRVYSYQTWEVEIDTNCTLLLNMSLKNSDYKKNWHWVLTIGRHNLPNEAEIGNCINLRNASNFQLINILDSILSYANENSVENIAAVTIDLRLLGDNRQKIIDIIRENATTKLENKLIRSEVEMSQPIKDAFKESEIIKSVCQLFMNYGAVCRENTFSSTIIYKKEFSNYMQISNQHDAGLDNSSSIRIAFKE